MAGNKKNNNVVTNPVPVVQGLVSAPAANTLSAPPADWTPPPRIGRGLRRAMASQKRAILPAAQEVAGAGDFASTFGAGAPDQAGFANALALAGNWSVDVKQVARWVVWGRLNELEAWAHAFKLLDAFQPVFEGAVARTPSVAEKYPSLVRYYAANHARGQAGAATRKAAAQAIVKAAKEAKGSSSPSSPSNAGGAAPTGK